MVEYNLNCLRNKHNTQTSEYQGVSSRSQSSPVSYKVQDADYYRMNSSPESGLRQDKDAWLHAASLPLLCLNINSISSLILPSGTTGDSIIDSVSLSRGGKCEYDTSLVNITGLTLFLLSTEPLPADNTDLASLLASTSKSLFYVVSSLLGKQTEGLPYFECLPI